MLPRVVLVAETGPRGVQGWRKGGPRMAEGESKDGARGVQGWRPRVAVLVLRNQTKCVMDRVWYEFRRLVRFSVLSVRNCFEVN